MHIATYDVKVERPTDNHMLLYHYGRCIAALKRELADETFFDTFEGGELTFEFHQGGQSKLHLIESEGRTVYSVYFI